MNPDEVRLLVEKIVNTETQYYWIYILLSALISIFVTILVDYTKEKGKNWATKQDIEEITSKIENVKATIQHVQEIVKQKRELKYNTLLNSLSIVDANLSHFLIFKDGTKINKQFSSAFDTRSCHNNLILTCENPEVITMFIKLLSAKENLSPDEVSELLKTLNEYRNLVRQELGFGNELILSNDLIWFAKVNFEREEKSI